MAINKDDPLYLRIVRAVAETEPHRAGEVQRVLDRYTGSPIILRSWLEEIAEELNPWRATANMRLAQAIFRTPAEMKGSGQIHGISLGGQKLTDQYFVFCAVNNPVKSAVLGSQAATKILESFGTREQVAPFSPEGKKRIGKERVESGTRALRDFATTLDEILQDPRRVRDVQGRHDRLKVLTILGLDEALRTRMRSLDALVYGNQALVDPSSPTCVLAADPGGMLFRWLRSQKDTMPLELRDIYTSLTNPHTQLSEEDIRQKTAALFVYAALHRPIDRDAILAGHIKDLNYFIALAKSDPDHPIIKKYGVPDLAPLRPILQRKEITLFDALQVLDIPQIDAARRAENGRYYHRNQKEVHAAVERLHWLFMEEGTWREDSLGASIPSQRLKTTLPAAVLSQKDFGVVRNWLRLRTLSGSDHNLFRSQPIQDFADVIDGVVVAQRKMQYLDERLRELGTPVDEHAMNAEPLLSTLKNNPFRTSTVKRAEEFEKKHGMTLDDCIARCEEMLGHDQIWQARRTKFALLRKYGLFDDRADRGLIELIGQARSFVPVGEIKEDVEIARWVYLHPLRVHARHEWYIVPEKKYVTQDIATTLVEARAVARELERIENAYRNKPEFIAHLLQRRRELRGEEMNLLHYFNLGTNGFLHNGEKPAWFGVRSALYDSFEDHSVRQRLAQEAVILDPEHLERHLDNLVLKYVPKDALEEGWLERAEFLASREAESWLPCLGLKGSSAGSYGVVQELKRAERAFVQKRLIEHVDLWFDRIETMFQYAPETLSGVALGDFDSSPLLARYDLRIAGTTRDDAGRFKTTFPHGFYFDGQTKEWRQSNKAGVTKATVGDMSLRIRAYNRQHNAALRVVVQKR